MNVIYKPIKKETSAKGYWLDDTGKIHIDNISFIPIESQGQFDYEVNKLFKLGEKAVFYQIKDKAYIKNCDGSILKLDRLIIRQVKKLDPNYIKGLLKTYSGLTIINLDYAFKIEIWTKKGSKNVYRQNKVNKYEG